MGTLVRLYYLAALAIFATGFCPASLPLRDRPAAHAVRLELAAVAAFGTEAACPCRLARALPPAPRPDARFTPTPPILQTRRATPARPRAPPTLA